MQIRNHIRPDRPGLVSATATGGLVVDVRLNWSVMKMIVTVDRSTCLWMKWDLFADLTKRANLCLLCSVLLNGSATKCNGFPPQPAFSSSATSHEIQLGIYCLILLTEAGENHNHLGRGNNQFYSKRQWHFADQVSENVFLFFFRLLFLFIWHFYTVGWGHSGSLV